MGDDVLLRLYLRAKTFARNAFADYSGGEQKGVLFRELEPKLVYIYKVPFSQKIVAIQADGSLFATIYATTIKAEHQSVIGIPDMMHFLREDVTCICHYKDENLYVVLIKFNNANWCYEFFHNAKYSTDSNSILDLLRTLYTKQLHRSHISETDYDFDDNDQ